MTSLLPQLTVLADGQVIYHDNESCYCRFFLPTSRDMLSPGQSQSNQPDNNHDITDLLLIKFANTLLLIKSIEF